MISLILLKLFTFSQILQGVPKLLHATVYIYIYSKEHYEHLEVPEHLEELKTPNTNSTINQWFLARGRGQEWP